MGDEWTQEALTPAATATAGGAADWLAAAKLSVDDPGLALELQASAPVSCRRTKKLEYFRIRPGDEWTATLYLYQERLGDGIPGEACVVLPYPDLIHALAGEAKRTTLRLAVNRGGAVILFPIPDGTDTGGLKRRAALLRATNDAIDSWVRLEWDTGANGYLHHIAQGDLGDPMWPPETAIPTMDAALKLAFTDECVIRDADHPAIQRALGLR